MLRKVLKVLFVVFLVFSASNIVCPPHYYPYKATENPSYRVVNGDLEFYQDDVRIIVNYGPFSEFNISLWNLSSDTIYIDHKDTKVRCGELEVSNKKVSKVFEGRRLYFENDSTWKIPPNSVDYRNFDFELDSIAQIKPKERVFVISIDNITKIPSGTVFRIERIFKFKKMGWF